MNKIYEVKPAMMHTTRVLLVDDDQDILTAGKLLLKRAFDQVVLCNNPANIPELMAHEQFDAILLDMNFGPGESTGEQGFAWLETILERDPQAVVVVITAHVEVRIAVDAMKRGATDFIAKPWDNDKLLATLSSAVKLSHSRREAQQLRAVNKELAGAIQQHSDKRIQARSPAMQRVLNVIERTAPTDANVLILGENGTGKEVIAKQIHRQSARSDKVFMSVDMGALSENLFESELFGHTKGAFTGAQSERVGRILAADKGTLFLDEIGNLPLHLQAKLLSVLQQRQVTPVGSNKAIAFDVRVISATNVDRQALSDESTFRQDLLFRLNTVELTLPPLRERPEDIPALIATFVQHFNHKYAKSVEPPSPSTLLELQQYAWPGNIRALRHAIERAVIMCETRQLGLADFQLSHPGDAVQTQSSPTTELNLANLEKQTISQALRKHRYNISHAAKALGLTRAALYRRMEKHGL